VRCLSGFFAHGGVLFFRDDFLVSLPEVALAVSRTVGRGDPLPEALTGGLAAIPDGVSNDLPRVATERNPDPAFAGLFQHT